MKTNIPSRLDLSREYWYKKFPIAKKCVYCFTAIDRNNSQRVLRVLQDGKFMLLDICLVCLPKVRASTLAKQGGASIIDHNTNTIISSNPNHVRELLELDRSG